MNRALIIARGQEVPPATGFDTAIASLSVGGDVRYARVLAGFDYFQALDNADASIGAVKVGGDWSASDLVAGAQDTGNTGFGLGDTLQAGGSPTVIARIASISIKGAVTGSIIVGDNYGFVAEQIDSVKISGRALKLDDGPSNDSILIAFTDDVRVLEVS